MTELDQLEQLYSEPQTCAQLVGLSYVASDEVGYTRHKHGKGFRYSDHKNQSIVDRKLKQRITSLVIPPAWQEVWICPKPNGHILATGIDERGRKQYIYHTKWRTMRDLIKFYRMIIFAHALPKIRKQIAKDLRRRNLDREKVLATMLWLLDNTYIRVGNDLYYQQNESIGLTTLTDKNVIIAGSVSTLSFRAKSGKDQQITFDDPAIATILTELKAQPGPRLFRYRDSSGPHEIDAPAINNYLYELTGSHISAKDFRTWGGTLMAFNHLIEAEKHTHNALQNPDKVRVQAIDAAANVLGNTRSVARSSYVHPDILSAYGTKHFVKLYEQAQKKRKTTELDKREVELLYFLERLFEEEFTILKNTTTN